MTNPTSETTGPPDDQVVPPSPRRSATRRRTALAAVAVLGALGFLVWKGLGEATVYFYRADEAVARRAELGDRRFRLEGIVVPGKVTPTTSGVNFAVEENGAEIAVVHKGDPPELFRPGIPVVLEGSWSGDRFASDRILVKHTSEYRKDNPERVEEYQP